MPFFPSPGQEMGLHFMDRVIAAVVIIYRVQILFCWMKSSEFSSRVRNHLNKRKLNDKTGLILDTFQVKGCGSGTRTENKARMKDKHFHLSVNNTD